MGQQKKLQMMTFLPKTSTIEIYTLGFPTEWKEKLAELAIAGNSTYNYDKYVLPLCSVLAKLCVNWVHGLIEITGMRKNSDDSRWIVCLSEIDLRMCEEICVNLKAAAYSYYDKKKNDAKVQEALKNFIGVIDPNELVKHIGKEEVEIIDKNGNIKSSYAYNGLCLKIMSNLVGKTIMLDGEPLTLYYSARNELMSQVLAGPKDLYAYVFSFSLQTIPADSYPMLLLNCSRRRFKNTSKRSMHFLKNKMSVYVKHKEEPCYCKLKMDYNFEKKCVDWDQADRSCYNFTYPNGLPEAKEVIEALEKYNSFKSDPQILCTCSTVNSYEDESDIGVGVSALDKESFYNSIYSLISDMVFKSQPNAKTLTKSVKLHPTKELIDIRSCLAKTGYEGAKIEIYSFSQDCDLAQRIKERSEELLAAANNETVDFNISVETLVFGDYATSLSQEKYANATERISRIRLISERLGRATEQIMTGSIIVLPKNTTKEKDAKDLLRCGFAMSNRVTQFINPNEESQENGNGLKCKIDNTIYDLLRQFGYTKSPQKWGKLPVCPVIAIDSPSNLNSMTGKKVRTLPMMLKFNFDDRMITVESPAINNGLPVPYFKACLEICKLSLNSDCERICKEATRRYVEQKMKGLENVYRFKDAVVIVSGDGFIRSELWPGISNKKISTYSFIDKYCPESIEVGDKLLPATLSLNNSKLRVVRIRCNDEVPDYYFKNDEKTSGSSDGLFLFRDVYYASAVEKSRDDRYRKGDGEYSISNPKQSYLEKRIIEYYPLSLCKDDDSKSIINYLNELRGLSPQFNKITNFPLPLHYLDKIKEYFDFDLN